MVTHQKSKKELWESLQHYHFDNLVPIHLTDRVAEMFGGRDASTKAFASKLSRKLGWTAEFALRATAEYKKYVYLGVISTKNVTPSKVIDQIWHEHQLFTKAYREFCREVIDKEFDHTPELIPVPEQTQQFNQQYLDTLALYRAEFNVEPPADIWAVTKFDPQLLPAKSTAPKRRRNDDTAGSETDPNDPPLYMQVDSPASEGQPSPSFHGFGGGTSGGAGATGDWGAPSHAPTHSHSSHDAGHSGHGGDGGHASGGDGGASGSGSSDSGGSSCSSSCGGGSCGGG